MLQCFGIFLFFPPLPYLFQQTCLWTSCWWAKPVLATPSAARTCWTVNPTVSSRSRTPSTASSLRNSNLSVWRVQVTFAARVRRWTTAANMKTERTACRRVVLHTVWELQWQLGDVGTSEKERKWLWQICINKYIFLWSKEHKLAPVGDFFFTPSHCPKGDGK